MTTDKLELKVGDAVYSVRFERINDTRQIDSYSAGKVNLFRVADAIKCVVFSAYDRVGWSFRSRYDMPDTRKGQKIAFGRAIKTMPKYMRRMLWKAYLAERPAQSSQSQALRKWLQEQLQERTKHVA